MVSQDLNEEVFDCFRAAEHYVARTAYRFRRRKFVVGLLSAISLFSLRKTLATTRDGNFLSLSCFLTGRTVNADLAERFFAAFIAQDVAFDGKVALLSSAIASQAHTSVDDLDMDGLSADAQRSARAILSAWYTGVVGDGPQAAVVTFYSAFLYDATRDALVVPSYSSWKVNYWTQPPPSAPESGVLVPRPHFSVWLRAWVDKIQRRFIHID